MPVPVHASAAVRMVPSPPSTTSTSGLCVAASANARAIWSDSPHHVLQLVTPAPLRMSSISASDSESQPPLEVLIMAPTFICDTWMPAGSMSELIRDINLRVLTFRRRRSPLLRKQADARNVPALLLPCELKRKKPARQKERRLSPQRLCGSAERRCRKASFDFAPQSETRSTEALRICGDDRNSRRSPIRKSQERLQISLGRQEIWRATDAGAIRTFEPDAV